MALTRLELKNYLKSSRGLTRAREDGLLTDVLLNEAVGKVLTQLAIDCHIPPIWKKFARRQGQWIYKMPQECFRVSKVWYKEPGGSYEPITKVSQGFFLDYRDPATDTAQDPTYYSYPIFEPRVLQPYGKAPPNEDFVGVSHVTTASRRTVIDSGINLGKTRDGTRISPGMVVYNRDDDSYGYIEVLNMESAKASGTAGAGTDSNTLDGGGVNFVTANVKEDDIIVKPSTGVVQTYAFVTSVSAASLEYTDARGAETAFAAGEGYRVGTANRARISTAAPHRAMREGLVNEFSVSAATATVTATTFTDTRCTGTFSATPSAGEIAIASGGSHGKIETVASGYVDVDHWIGGKPADGETVEIKTCDEYQIEMNVYNERTFWLGPTCSENDTIGTERILVLYVRKPLVPQYDWEELEIGEYYTEVLEKCMKWKAADLTGIYSPDTLAGYEVVYRESAERYAMDVMRPPLTGVMTVWGNRGTRAAVGVKDQTPNGIAWDLNI